MYFVFCVTQLGEDPWMLATGPYLICFCFVSFVVMYHSCEYNSRLNPPSESLNLGMVWGTLDTFYTPLKV